MWFNYRQNNSGGSFNYDPTFGISVNVWVEAADSETADSRAKDIGIYFDGYGDCSCCGDRWSSKSDYSWNDEGDEDPPAPKETLKRDEFDSFSGHKWLPVGDYETFVHPLQGPFYGAHATVEVVKKLTFGRANGYGVTVGKDYVSDKPTPVSELGWDKTGNYSAPSPGYQFYRPADGNKLYVTKDGLRIEQRASYARVWSPTKDQAALIIEEINTYLDVTPRPKPVEHLLELYPGEVHDLGA